MGDNDSDINFRSVLHQIPHWSRRSNLYELNKLLDNRQISLYLPRALTKVDLKIFGGPRAVIPKNDIFCNSIKN